MGCGGKKEIAAGLGGTSEAAETKAAKFATRAVKVAAAYRVAVFVASHAMYL